MRIAVLSGKRGGYDAMLPLLRAAKKDPDVELELILTDHHGSERFGNMAGIVVQEFPNAWVIQVPRVDDSAEARSVALAQATGKLARHLFAMQPDCLILFGDRQESAYAAVAAVEMQIPVIHLQAGDVTGNVDEKYRWMISFAADLCFASCVESAQRLIGRGIEPKQIRTVGDWHLDGYAAQTAQDTQAARKWLAVHGIKKEAFIILLQHPDTTVKAVSTEAQIATTITAIKGFRKEVDTIAIYPCSDPGYQTIIDYLEAASCENFQVFKNIPGELFRPLLRLAKAIVGNSSTGIIEAPFVGTWGVNIGKRQRNRTQYDVGTINVDFTKARITAGIKDSLHKQVPPIGVNRYGLGQAGVLTLKELKKRYKG
jgi:UDP-hydrolysing UDP-N-acetyl-D-glucosamine 2-epimerase